MVTPRPDVPDETMPDEARRSQTKKMAGFIWLPAPEVCRKLQESCPDDARQHQNFPLFTKKDRIWCCLAQSGQLVSSFLQTSGAGSQIEPAIFWSGSVWDDFVWLVWSWCNHTMNLRSNQLHRKRSIVPMQLWLKLWQEAAFKAAQRI